MIGGEKEKVDIAIESLRDQGHTVKVWVRDDGKFWFEIDSRMLASRQEMVHLADGVYSLAELEELYERRHAEKGRGSNANKPI